MGTKTKLGILAFLLAATLIGGNFALGVRILATYTLIVAAPFVLLATIPPRFVVYAIRFLTIAVALRIAWSLHLGAPLAAALVAICGFVIGLAPSVKVGIRKWIYGTTIAVVIASLIASLSTTTRTADSGDLAALFAFGGGSIYLFQLWVSSRKSWLVEAIERLHRGGRKMLDYLNAPGGTRAPKVDPRHHRELIRQLDWFTEMVPTSDSYRVVQSLCAGYPKTALSWKMAYVAALYRGDYRSAEEIILKGKAFGFDEELGDLPLAFALQGQGHPTWKAIRGKAREAGEPGIGIGEDCGNPLLRWRSDPEFANLEYRLAPFLSGTEVQPSVPLASQ